MNENTTKKQVLVDITIAAPIERVWLSLRDPKLVESWFGWEADTLTDEIKYIFVDQAVGDETHHVIQFKEWEGEGISERIELAVVEGGTRLTLVRSGGVPIDWTGVYEDISQGWITFFQQLRLALELHPGEERRTIYLSGAAREGVGEPAAELGLGKAANYQAGEPYSAQLATDHTAQGKVWYTTHFQTALVVEQFGNGLIVVTDKGVSPERPRGGGSVLITTYGLSQGAFAALEAKWKTWWGERFEAAEEQCTAANS
ncbi:SRPBCC family protein [Paremcibacter congregatus]|uniref:SRPBCC family protein n=1 Tax=Paremcibacter congregatus TaxID=2043170 RepID=UPI003A8F09DD